MTQTLFYSKSSPSVYLFLPWVSCLDGRINIKDWVLMRELVVREEVRRGGNVVLPLKMWYYPSNYTDVTKVW